MTVESLVEAGKLELKKGSREKAHGLFLEALELAPDNINILLYLAASSTTKEQADKYLNWVERLSPDHKGLEKGRIWAQKLPSRPEQVDRPVVQAEQQVEAEGDKDTEEDNLFDQYRELSEDSSNSEKGKKLGEINLRIVIPAVVVLFVLLVIAVFVVLPRLFSQPEPKDIAVSEMQTDTTVVEIAPTATLIAVENTITQEAVLQLPPTWTPQYTNTPTVRPSKTPAVTDTTENVEESIQTSDVENPTETPSITLTPTSTLAPNNQNYPLQNLSNVLENPENYVGKRLRVTGYLYFKSYMRIDNEEVYALQLLPDLSEPSDEVESGTTLVVLGFEPDLDLIEFSEVTVYGVGLGQVEEKAPLRDPVSYNAIWGVSYSNKEP